MQTTDAVKALSALAQGHRLEIFRMLVRAGSNGMSAGEIARALGISPASLTFHMKELEHAGLIRSWREGRFVLSAVSVDGMRALIAFLTEDCCNGRPELCGAGIAAARSACCESEAVEE